MIYPLLILSAIGANKIIETIGTQKNILKRSIIISIFWGMFIYSTIFYLLSYSVFTPMITLKGPAGWSCGYKEMVEKTGFLKEKYDKVVIDTTYQGPYIFFLFFEKYPPEKYHPQAKLTQGSTDSLGEGAGYDKYEFRPIFWPEDRGSKNTLFVGPPERLPLKDIDPKQSELIDTQKFINDEDSFLFVETN